MSEGWTPPDGAWERSRVGSFASRHGIADLEALRRRSVEDPAWFWDAVVADLGIPFESGYDAVLDTSDGIAWTRWFTGGRTNLAAACVDRWAETTPDATAVTWEDESGSRRSWTFSELRRHADGLASRLAELGVGEGDAVGIFLPMLPETVAAVMGVAKLGAVFLPVFSGYGPDAVAVRLADAGARVLLTSTVFSRRGRDVGMLEVATAALAGAPEVRDLVVLDRRGDGLGRAPDGVGVHPWPSAAGEPFPTVPVDSEHTLFLAYTSGTTGRPKGVVHVHGGWTVKVAEEAAFQFDCGPADTLFWLTDIGWIMGPWAITGALANGATLALFDGAPDHPGPGRPWELVERHGATILGLSPTLVRALMARGDEHVSAHDRSSLRVLGSTGEPWNDEPWRWYHRLVGQGRCPVINISGGTEVGACFLSPHPVEPIAPTSLGGPSLGMAVDVYDEDGRPVRGEVGELVCTAPWPGMTRGLYRDPDRYLETYWSRWDGVWVHGDWASIVDGEWFLHGRSDDTIKVAGKRLGPAEAESALVAHPDVVEAAAVGVPDEVKGNVLWCFVVTTPAAVTGDELRSELSDRVVDALGPSFRPQQIRFADRLPKTRSAKVVRRAIRATALGEDPGDLSSLEDPTALEAIEAAR